MRTSNVLQIFVSVSRFRCPRAKAFQTPLRILHSHNTFKPVRPADPSINNTRWASRILPPMCFPVTLWTGCTSPFLHKAVASSITRGMVSLDVRATRRTNPAHLYTKQSQPHQMCITATEYRNTHQNTQDSWSQPFELLCFCCLSESHLRKPVYIWSRTS